MRELADAAFVHSLELGLEYLLGEASYRTSDLPTDLILSKDIPRMRRLAVEMAQQLVSVSYSRSPVVQRWLDAAPTDPLPEVRRAIVE